MPTASPLFTQNTAYAYAVARVRALETRLIDSAGFGSLLSAAPDRLAGALAETARLKTAGAADVETLLGAAEESFTQTLLEVKSLLLEDTLKRLVSLKYDYEIVKFVVKEEREGGGGQEVPRGETSPRAPVPGELSKRSNYSYPVLKALLEGGKALETGQAMMGAYLSLKRMKEVTGRVVDDACDRAYYSEAFAILQGFGNDFLTGYFTRQVDALNILAALRLKARKEKRASLRERSFPFGSVDLSHLESGFDLSLDAFASKLAFTPFSSVMKSAVRGADEGGQAVALERALDEELLRYLRESTFVTFGVEPVLAYLWVRENEVKNLRTIILSKASGLPPEEIRNHLRGVHG
jgi:V/A-type H+-transporting ATPase subunit C